VAPKRATGLAAGITLGTPDPPGPQWHNGRVAAPGELLEWTDKGFYCAAGDFYVDPLRPVDRAVVTHCHSDHARPGSRHYLAASEGEAVLRLRVGEDASIQTLSYGERLRLGSVTVSLHPAGHILGSAQVRIAWRDQVWVVSGDYKTEPDPTCTPFEPVRCDVFVSESTFGLPIYQWPEPASVYREINEWWRLNQAAGRTSVLFAYAVGKAQRVLAGVDSGIGPLFVHGAMTELTEAYRRAGIELPPVSPVATAAAGVEWSQALVLAPPSAGGSPWMRRFGDLSSGFVSGWMLVRGVRRRRSIDRGFVLSDHADWPGLLSAVETTGASRVLLNHGYAAQVARFLREERGIDAGVIEPAVTREQEEA